MTGVKLETFKRALDRFLKTIPDEPQIPGYTACRRADSNSILQMINVKSKTAGGSLLLSGEAEHIGGPATTGDV